MPNTGGWKMNQTNLDQQKMNQQNQMRQIEEALSQAKITLDGAENELRELNENTLPRSLAHFSLERVSRNELQKIKRKIRDLQEIISDFPLLTKGLESEKTKSGVEGQKLYWAQRNLTKYEALKQEVQENGLTRDTENNLLGLARELDCVDEAKSFIDGLKVKKT